MSGIDNRDGDASYRKNLKQIFNPCFWYDLLSFFDIGNGLDKNCTRLQGEFTFSSICISSFTCSR